MLLMNGDRAVLEFDLNDMYIKVLDNDFLPYALKDYVVTTNPADFKKSLTDIQVLRDYLSSRLLTLSRDNAKVLLNVLSLPQTLKTEERVKIALKCRGLSMTDNIWTKDSDEILSFIDICLRNNKLSDICYQVSILGEHVSACLEDLKCDLVTSGMFLKTWKRTDSGMELWKSDKTDAFINTKAELKASAILDTTNVEHVTYHPHTVDGRLFAVSKCFATDAESFVTAQEVMDYCNHVGANFLEFVKSSFSANFANMCIIDYIIGNTDRHSENWGFMIDNATNVIKRFAPLFDHNQALVCDCFGADIDSIVYGPTGLSMFESALRAKEFGNVEFRSDSALTLGCCKRYDKLFIK